VLRKNDNSATPTNANIGDAGSIGRDVGVASCRFAEIGASENFEKIFYFLIHCIHI
jgi:hypothetical protein